MSWPSNLYACISQNVSPYVYLSLFVSDRCFRTQHWRGLTEGSWEAAAFYSRQTRGAEQRYSATELEALTLVESIHHFVYYLYGRTFKAYTDHKSLCQLLMSDRLNPWLRRLAMKLQHWLVYLPGKENGMADTLSREEQPKMVSLDKTQDTSLAAGNVGVPTPTCAGNPAKESAQARSQNT